MRVLLTLTALLVGFNAPAQTTFWNPDADGNGYVSASDLLPFLGVFGLDFEATPLYCQDTASWTALYEFDGDYATSQSITLEAPLVPLIFIVMEGTSQYDNPDLILPTDSVPNGYRVSIVNTGSKNVDVEPMSPETNDGVVYKGTHVQYFFFGGVWYPFYVPG